MNEDGCVTNCLDFAGEAGVIRMLMSQQDVVDFFERNVVGRQSGLELLACARGPIAGVDQNRLEAFEKIRVVVPFERTVREL